MKRKLDSKYKELVDYVTNRQGGLYLSTIIGDFINGDTLPNQILHDLITDNSSYIDELDEVVQIIVDIYNDNYELNEPLYSFRLKGAKDSNSHSLYLGVGSKRSKYSSCWTKYSYISPGVMSMTEKYFLENLPEEMSPDQFEKERVDSDD